MRLSLSRHSHRQVDFFVLRQIRYNPNMDYAAIVDNFLKNHSAFVKNDQFFLIDQDVIDDLVDTAQITDADHVLEVGTGLAFLTLALAQRAKKVTTIEIDPRFHDYRLSLPSNVDCIEGDAYRLLNDRSFQKNHQSPTKTVSSIPYSQAQNMLHNYTNWSWYQGDVVWLASLSLVDKINSEPILGAYFEAQVVREVSKQSFLPQPDTKSAIIYFRRLQDPIETKNADIYFRRWLYCHEDMKVKNALREGIISLAQDLFKQEVSKKRAQLVINQLNISDRELNKLTNNINPRYYFELGDQIADLL